MRSNTVLGKPQAVLMAPMKYAALLATLGEKDRGSLERQITAFDGKAGAPAADRWRRLACVLRTLAPGPVKLAGSNAMQFFIPDGKYRKQVFAMQATGEGSFLVYAPDVVAEAVRKGLVSGLGHALEGNIYRVGKSDETLVIDLLDGKTPNPDAFFKDMTGWNRKAIRITLPAKPSDGQARAVEQICALAAGQWPAAVAAD
jgi:hypothetical protein